MSGQNQANLGEIAAIKGSAALDASCQKHSYRRDI